MQKMFLIQMLLPLYDKGKVLFPQSFYLELQTELTERFGGVTAYIRSPAKGLWKSSIDTTESDEVIMYEVQVNLVDAAWWNDFKIKLAKLFKQEVIVIRSVAMELI